MPASITRCVCTPFLAIPTMNRNVIVLAHDLVVAVSAWLLIELGWNAGWALRAVERSDGTLHDASDLEAGAIGCGYDVAAVGSVVCWLQTICMPCRVLT